MDDETIERMLLALGDPELGRQYEQALAVLDQQHTTATEQLDQLERLCQVLEKHHALHQVSVPNG